MAVFVGYERGTYDLIRESGEYGLSYCSDQQGNLAHVGSSLRKLGEEVAILPSYSPIYCEAVGIEEGKGEASEKDLQ